MAVSSHHIASSVGIEILKYGGNAVDAAIMSAVLCIAEPHMTVLAETVLQCFQLTAALI